MTDKQLTSMVREALKLPDAIVENLGIIGGMTNLNYLVSVDDVGYILRIPGHGTSSLIDRAKEIQCLKLGSALGINPELVYFNVDTGVKITRKIEHAQPLTKEANMHKEILRKVATIFKKLHHSSVEMNHTFNLFELMDEYEALALEAGGDFYSGFDEVKTEMKTLAYKYTQIPVKFVPCHIDPACSNFLLDDQGKMYLIDWEYGGMFDPLWDIAAFTLEAGLSVKEKNMFYQAYFGCALTEEEEERIMMHTIFQDYLWSLWTLFKEEKGDNFGLYGRQRFERAKENLQIYKDYDAMKYTAQ